MILQLVVFTLIRVKGNIHIYTCFRELHVGKEYSKNIHKEYSENKHALSITFYNFLEISRMMKL